MADTLTPEQIAEKYFPPRVLDVWAADGTLHKGVTIDNSSTREIAVAALMEMQEQTRRECADICNDTPCGDSPGDCAARILSLLEPK